MEIFLIRLLQFLLSISLLVLLHEGGHFFFAKLFKVRVSRFYIFFNPKFHLFSTYDPWFRRLFKKDPVVVPEVTKKDEKGKVVGKVSYPAFIADVDLVNWPGEPVAGRAVAFRKQGVRPVVGGSSTGTGTFSFSPAYGQASSNATVTVTATAAQDSVFACWILDGVIVGYGPSCKVTMRQGDFTGLMAVFHQAVAEVPEWVTGAYSGKGELGGKPAAVSFTVGTGGKVSGKFTVAKKSYAFSTSAVAEYGDALHATAPLVYGKKKYFVRLDFLVEDGGGTFAQIDVMRTDGYALEDGVAVSSFGRAWKK